MSTHKPHTPTPLHTHHPQKSVLVPISLLAEITFQSEDWVKHMAETLDKSLLSPIQVFKVQMEGDIIKQALANGRFDLQAHLVRQLQQYFKSSFKETHTNPTTITCHPANNQNLLFRTSKKQTHTPPRRTSSTTRRPPDRT